jgi:hypothetical protein
MNIGDVISIVALIVSIAAASITIVSLYKNYDVKRYELKASYRAEFLSWFLRTTEQLSLVRQCIESPEFDKQTALANISAQIAYGKKFFPNDKDTGDLRDVAMDFLMLFRDIFERSDATIYKKELEQLQGWFTKRFYSVITSDDFSKIDTQKNIFNFKHMLREDFPNDDFHKLYDKIDKIMHPTI